MSSLILHFSSFKYGSSAKIRLLVTTNWIHVYIFETYLRLLWYSYKCFRHTPKGNRVPVDTISFLTYPTERKKKNRLRYSVSEYWFLINISSFMTIVFVWVVHCSSTFITGLNNNEYQISRGTVSIPHSQWNNCILWLTWDEFWFLMLWWSFIFSNFPMLIMMPLLQHLYWQMLLHRNWIVWQEWTSTATLLRSSHFNDIGSISAIFLTQFSSQLIKSLQQLYLALYDVFQWLLLQVSSFSILSGWLHENALSDNSFDAIYAIDATCHAPDAVCAFEFSAGFFFRLSPDNITFRSPEIISNLFFLALNR